LSERRDDIPFPIQQISARVFMFERHGRHFLFQAMIERPAFSGGEAAGVFPGAAVAFGFPGAGIRPPG
jgi:hypothetical protein